MRAPQVVTPLAASDPDGLAALADAVSMAGWPRDLGHFFAGLDVTAQPGRGTQPAGRGTQPAGPAPDGCRLFPHPKKGTRAPCEALPVTGTSPRAERAGTGGRAMTRPGTCGAGTSGDGIAQDRIAQDRTIPHGQPSELRTLFEDAAAGLKLDEREVIELQLRQGLAAGEVAAVLGVSGKHAHLLLSRARSDLESCLGVLLVGRAGRDECGELAALLTGWDGRLTAVLRKRVQRHIEHCTTCTVRRAQELRPSMLRNLSPAAALAAGAAESFRLALGAPAALRAHTIALALGRGPSAGAHSTVVLARAGSFGRRGFPRPARAALAGRRGIGALGARLRACCQGRAEVAVVAVVALATAAVAAACALAGSSAHLRPAANPNPSASAPAPAASSAVAGLAPARKPGSSAAPAPGTPGAAVPGRRAGRTARNSPSISGYRHLRSWIESNRLR
jgi:predicted DNA-binding protein (UPF0251 family)